MKNILVAAVLAIFALPALAQNFSSLVNYVADDGKHVTLMVTATGKDKKAAEIMAMMSAFNFLFHSGVPELKNGVPMLATANDSYEKRFYEENRYVNYIVGKPITNKLKKVAKVTRVETLVVINLVSLKADLLRNNLTLNPGWSDAKKVNATSALNPTIVVVPMMRQSEGYSFAAMRSKVENSRLAQFVVQKVSEGFRQNGFKTRDFTTMLQNNKTNQILRDGAQTDQATLIAQQLPGDIVVSVDATMFIENKNKGEITINLSAVEKQTSAELAAKSFASGFYYNTDSVALAQHALDKMTPDFFAQVNKAFEEIISKGREVIVDLNLSETVTDWDFDQDAPGSGIFFKDTLDEWLRDNSFQGVYDMSVSTDKYISIRLNIPLWDTEKNRSFTLSNFQSTLRRFFKEQLGADYKANITAMGQKCVVVIQ